MCSWSNMQLPDPGEDCQSSVTHHYITPQINPDKWYTKSSWFLYMEKLSKKVEKIRKVHSNAVFSGLRQRSLVVWVNEVISRDAVGCHMSDTKLRIQSPSHVSISGPPRQLANRSNTQVYAKQCSQSTTVVLHVIQQTMSQQQRKQMEHVLIPLWHFHLWWCTN